MQMRSSSWQLLTRLRPLLYATNHATSIPQIHALILTTGLFTDPNSTALLIASYAQNNNLVSARQVFDKSPLRPVVVWNAILTAYSRRKDPENVLSLYSEMLEGGIVPDSSTFTVAIKACSSLMEVESGEAIWRRAVGCGYREDMFVGSSVLNLYAKCGEMEKAKVVFDGMGKKDVVCWTSMVMGFVRCGKALEAVGFYRRMREEGVEADEVVMLGLIQASADLGDVKLGASVHGIVVRRVMVRDGVFVQTSLVDMYAKNGKLEIASRVFRKMPVKTSASWGALISGFAQNGFSEEALQLVIEMQNFGFGPDPVALVSALVACSQVGCVKLGKLVHGYVVRNVGFEQVLHNGLIDMYSKCGVLPYARLLFDEIDSRDLISWNTMIAGYGIHGHGKEALSIFMKMREMSIKPDQATFAALLSGLSHSGLVEEGLYWFEVMINEYKIQPSEKHYASMVDLLSRAGRLEEAFRLIESMNKEPELAIWVALLSGCYNYRNIPVGEMVAKQILDSNSDELGVYALVSNFFSMARKWDQVANLRKFMKKTGVRKVPGYSALEVNGKHIACLMEDSSLSGHRDAMNVLDTLCNEMRAIRFAIEEVLC